MKFTHFILLLLIYLTSCKTDEIQMTSEEPSTDTTSLNTTTNIKDSITTFFRCYEAYSDNVTDFCIEKIDEKTMNYILGGGRGRIVEYRISNDTLYYLNDTVEELITQQGDTVYNSCWFFVGCNDLLLYK